MLVGDISGADVPHVRITLVCLVAARVQGFAKSRHQVYDRSRVHEAAAALPAFPGDGNVAETLLTFKSDCTCCSSTETRDQLSESWSWSLSMPGASHGRVHRTRKCAYRHIRMLYLVQGIVSTINQLVQVMDEGIGCGQLPDMFASAVHALHGVVTGRP
jgi:hypothetical protein